MGMGVGVIAFAVNMMPMTLGGGLDFLFGGIGGFVLFRVVNWKAGFIAIAISSIATIFLWHHPWAYCIWLLEYLFVTRLPFFRRAPLICHSIAFWIFVGAPLLLLTYGGWMGMALQDALLVVQKQAINGFLNLAVANCILMALAWILAFVSPLLRKKVNVRPLGLSEQAVSSLLIFALLPLVAEAKFDSNRLYASAYEEASVELMRTQDKIFQRLQGWLVNQERWLVAADHLWSGHSHLQEAVHAIAGMADANATNIESLCIVPATGDPLSIFVKDEQSACPADKPIPQMGHGDALLRMSPANGGLDASMLLFWKQRSEADTNIWIARYRIADIERAFMLNSLVSKGVKAEVRYSVGLQDELEGEGIGSEKPDVVDNDIGDPLRLGRRYLPEKLGTPVMITAAQTAIQLPFVPVVAENWKIELSSVPAQQIKKIRNIQSEAMGRMVLLTIVAVLSAAVIGLGTTRVISDLVSSIPFSVEKDGVTFPRSARTFEEGADIYAGLDRAQRSLVEKSYESLRLRNILKEVGREAPLGIYVVELIDDVEPKVELKFASQSILSMMGLPEGESFRTTLDVWKKRIHPTDATRLTARMQGVQTGARDVAEYRIKVADGTYRWVVDCTVVVAGRSPTTREMIGSIIDVTALKEAQESVMRLSKLSTLGEMAAGLAHEVNQPLQTITFAAANLSADLAPLLRQEGNPRGTSSVQVDRRVESISARLQIIEQQVDRAAEIISNISLFGRSQRPVMSVLQVDEIADAVASLAAIVCRERSIEFELAKPVVSCRVFANKISVEQILLNFVTNACDSVEGRYRTGDTSPGKVTLSIEERDEAVVFCIKDNGQGIAPDNIEKLFDPFFTTKPPGKGTGLGLSVAFGIARNLNGSLRAANIDGGAAFFLDLKKVV